MATTLAFAERMHNEPLNAWVDTAEATFSLGVCEMACRLNADAKNFDKAATNLDRTAQIKIGGESLRVLVETEGKQIVQPQKSGQLPPNWSAND